MKVTEYSGKSENRILASMLTNKLVLGKIREKWNSDGLFSSKWANTIAKWAISYYDRHAEAPKQSINAIFSNWVDRHSESPELEPMEMFMSELSRVYSKEKLGTSYVLEMAENVFSQNKMELHIRKAQGLISVGKITEANELMQSYNPILISEESWTDVFSDVNAMEQAFTESFEPVISYKDSLGTFMKGQLTRDAFISFMSPEKRGKTFWLIDMAFTALSQDRNVVFFEVGDMSRGQILRRFSQRFTKRPVKAGTIKIPKMLHKAGDSVEVEYQEKTFAEDLTFEEVRTNLVRLQERLSNKFKLSCHPSNSISAKGLESKLNELIRTGWVPDVVILDYADLLAPNRSGLESRDAINETWKTLRSISQQYHLLLVTATQSDAQSYQSNTLGMQNFSEDKRKLAHCTGMIGINQTPMEKMQQVQRLNWIVLREDEFHEGECVYVGVCRALSRMSCCSSF